MATSRRRRAREAAALAALLLAPVACSAPSPANDSGDMDWQTLIDGSGLDAWRGYQRQDVPSAWRIEDATLVLVPGSGEGGDLITREQYDDFELELEWRVGPAGNSGIFYRADEDARLIWHHAPEMQVLDDAGYPDLDAVHLAGGLYDLYVPAENVVRPAGEWNRVRIRADGPRVEHWLNGRKVVEYEQWGDEWEGRVAGSKFAEYPGYGRRARGHLGLQDHGDRVEYRDIRVRRLR